MTLWIQVARVTSLLEQTAPPAIATFDRRLRDEAQATHDRLDEVKEGSHDWGFTTLWSKAASVHTGIAAIQETIRSLQPLKLEVLDAETLDARLEAIWADLPEVDARPSKYCYGAP